jgi:hypothetical protein
MSSHTLDEVAELRSQIAQMKIKQRIERMVQGQKMELMKMQVAMDNERRDTCRQVKELEQKMENESRDRQVKELEQKMHQNMEMMKMQAALDNEKRDRDAALQIEHLKSDARFTQIEQQLATRAYYSQPVQHLASPTTGANEQLLLQHILELKSQEKARSQPSPAGPAVQPTPPDKPVPSRSSVPAGGAIAPTSTTRLKNITSSNTMANTAVPVPQSTPDKTNVASTSTIASRAAAPTPYTTNGSMEALAPKPFVPSRSEQQHSPSKSIQAQRQAPTGPAVPNGVTVQLPGDAQTHFFLSHCQATGGDQTNAIYLELRQLGFSCW